MPPRTMRLTRQSSTLMTPLHSQLRTVSRATRVWKWAMKPPTRPPSYQLRTWVKVTMMAPAAAMVVTSLDHSRDRGLTTRLQRQLTGKVQLQERLRAVRSVVP